jgi:hypothetical protein
MASVLSMTPIALAGEVQMTAFSFQLPRSWHVENGRERVFASPSATYSPEAPSREEVLPIFMAEVCVGTSDHPCPPSEAPDSSKDKGYVCTSPQMLWHTWPTGITAEIWICPRVVSPSGVGVTTAVAYFESANRKLRVAYMAGDHDKPPGEFLNDFAKSLRSK